MISQALKPWYKTEYRIKISLKKRPVIFRRRIVQTVDTYKGLIAETSDRMKGLDFYKNRQMKKQK